MANFGFSSTPTATALYKVINVNGVDWTDEQRMNCTLASAIGDLPDATAHARFLAILNTLGIIHSGSVEVNKEKTHCVDIYSRKGSTVTKMSDAEKRKAIAAIMWEGMDVEQSSQMIKDIKGQALDQMYNRTVKPKDATLPFVMYRIRIGSHVFYRVTNESISPESLVAQGINYLVDQKKINGIQIPLTIEQLLCLLE